MKRINILAVILVVFIIIIQFIPGKINVDYSDPSYDFISSGTINAEIAKIFKTSCYDCHSNSTIYPWYYKVAPVSWIINKHITEGRESLNFSSWKTFNAEDQKGILESCKAEITGNEMPLFSYKLLHPSAIINEYQKKILFGWINTFNAVDEDINKEVFQ